jgi:hypothetical protein
MPRFQPETYDGSNPFHNFSPKQGRSGPARGGRGKGRGGTRRPTAPVASPPAPAAATEQGGDYDIVMNFTSVVKDSPRVKEDFRPASRQVQKPVPVKTKQQGAGGRDDGRVHRVYVGGLPPSITEAEIKERFESFGRILNVELMRDKEDEEGEPRSFVFLFLFLCVSFALRT